jgi:hypothetical protein
MFRFPKVAFAALTLGTSLLVGCQADNKPPESTLVTTDKGVICTKCQTTWVKVPITGDKNKIVAYRTQAKMTCPDCKNAVENFFATGKLERTCKTCGDSMEICEEHM